MEILLSTFGDKRANRQTRTAHYALTWCSWCKERGAGIAQPVQWLGYGLDNRSSITGKGRDFFFLRPRLYRLWGPLSILFNGYRDSFPGVKRPEREADHSPPSSAEVKNVWAHRNEKRQVHVCFLQNAVEEDDGTLNKTFVLKARSDRTTTWRTYQQAVMNIMLIK
jgi:hypothetical protein